MRRMLIVSGQCSVDDEARTLHPGDMRAQIVQAMDNLQTVLGEAGYELSDVVSLNYYATDMDRFYEAYDALTSRLEEANCWPASTLLGVARLAYPDLLVEIEATA